MTGSSLPALHQAALLFALLLLAHDVCASDGPEIAQRFQRLTRASSWRKVTAVKLQFPTYHPQGLAIVGDRLFLSAVEVVNRELGRGRGHLFELDFKGRLRRQIQLGAGPEYHPGGIDFDGTWIWVPVAEYRPDSASTVYRVHPATMESNRVFDFDDHLGAIVCDKGDRRLVGVNWGARRFYQWELQDAGSPSALDVPTQASNGNFYIDYQDGQSLPGTGLALFGGLGRVSANEAQEFVLGGLELVDLRELRAKHQLPVALRAPSGRSMLQNPFAVEPGKTGLRFYFIPDDHDSTLYVYDIE
jgi:hypothetical protein